MCDRQTCSLPALESAVENMDILMSKELQKPKQPCRSHSCHVVIDDDGTVGIDALRLDEVLDDPEEGVEGLGACVDETDTEDVEAACSRDVTVGVGFGLP